MTTALPATIEGSPTRPSQRLRIGQAALFAGLLTTALRWWVGHDRVVLRNIWDEGANLAIARTLAGDDWSTQAATYRPGLGTLLAPIHWFVEDAELSYRLSLLVLAMVAGAVAALLVVLMARITSAPLGWVALAALVAASLPGALLQGLWVTPESLISLIVVGTQLALVAFVSRPTLGRGLIVAVLPGVGFATHGRLAPLLASVSLVFVVMVLARRLSAWVGVLLLVVAGAATAAAQVYARWTLDRVWAVTDASARFDSVLERLGEPVGILLSAAGMTWYQLVTTAGIVALGGWAVWMALLARGEGTGVDLSRVHALLLVVVLAPAMAISAVWMTGGQAPGHLVYGRYWDALLGPIVALGVLLLARARRRTLMQSVLVVWLSLVIGGVAFAYVRQDAIDAAIEQAGGLGSRRRMLSLLAFTGGQADIDIMRTTLIALAISTVLLALSALRLHRSWGTVLLASALVVLIGVANNQAMLSVNSDQLNGFAASGVVADVVEDGPAPGETIGIRWDTPDVSWMETMRRWMVYQFYLPDNPIVGLGDDRLPEVAEPAFVFASPDDPRLIAAGADVVWSHPDEPFALWYTAE